MGATILKNPPIGYENVFAGNFDITPDDRIEVSSENYTSIYVIDKWNGSEWIEGATAEQIAEYNRNIVPRKISRMKFIIQINRSTGIKYEDIAIFINNIPNEYLSENEKYEIISRLKAAVDFERYNTDLLTIAQMMGITSEQLDSIFINGNLLN